MRGWFLRAACLGLLASGGCEWYRATVGTPAGSASYPAGQALPSDQTIAPTGAAPAATPTILNPTPAQPTPATLGPVRGTSSTFGPTFRSTSATQILPDGWAEASRTQRGEPGQQPVWREQGRSVEGRPLEVLVQGDGPHKALLIGSLYGDEEGGVKLAELLAAELLAHQNLVRGATVTIVRDANPDGRARRTPDNARQVDLNRNFNSRDWREVREQGWLVSGDRPESEPETTALAAWIERHRPQRVVLLRSGSAFAGVKAAGSATALARAVAEQANARLVLAAADSNSGSLLSFAEDLSITAFELELPRGESPGGLWKQYRGALLTALGLPLESAPAATGSRTVGIPRPFRSTVRQGVLRPPANALSHGPRVESLQSGEGTSGDGPLPPAAWTNTHRWPQAPIPITAKP